MQGHKDLSRTLKSLSQFIIGLAIFSSLLCSALVYAEVTVVSNYVSSSNGSSDSKSIPLTNTTAQLTSPMPNKTLVLADKNRYVSGTYWAFQEAQAIAPMYISHKFTQIIESGDWETSTHDHINFGFRRHAYWLKLSVNNNSQREWLLWNHYSLLDTVALYVCPKGNENPALCRAQIGGDLQPYDTRTIDHPNLIFPLGLEPNKSYDLYLYVATEGTYQLSLELIDAQTLNKNLLNNNLIRGGYYAIMLAMGLYNFLLFFAIRDRTYFYYSAFVFSFLFFHMNFEGAAFGYFWPDQPHWNQVMMPLSFAIAQFFFSLFLPRILDLKKYAPGSWLVYKIYTPVTVLFMILAFTTPYYFAVSLQNLVNALIAIYTLIIGVRVWLVGYQPARLFTLAWTTFILGTISVNMSSLGILPGNPLILYGYQIGSVIDVILLSLALGARINQLRKERERDQQQLNASQQEAITYLKQYEDLYQNAIAGRFQLNGQGIVTGCNPAFARTLGFNTPDDLIANHPHIDQFIQSTNAAIELWETLENKKQIQGYQLTMMPRRGKMVDGILTMRREFSSANQYWVGALLDITENCERERELERLEENRDLSIRQLVMGISHEMNTPLGNIRLANSHLSGYLSDIKSQELRDNLDQGVQHISSNVDRLVKLNEVIQTSLAEDANQKPETIHLKAWLRSWQERAQNNLGNLEIEIICSQDNAVWHGHAETLDAVLMQLADNSVFHNSELSDSGNIYIRISVTLQSNVLNLHYQDNGKGVSEDDKDKIFLPFYTTQRTRAKKKGLGMYEVHNMVTRAMNGTFEWPVNGNGFAITLLLPAASQAEEDAEN